MDGEFEGEIASKQRNRPKEEPPRSSGGGAIGVTCPGRAAVADYVIARV